jgi:HEAT repeat protein
MRSSFGPWATTMDVGRGPRLSTFWKRRLAMLHATGQSRRSLTRRTALALTVAGILACALPTFRGLAIATGGEGPPSKAAQQGQVSAAENPGPENPGQPAVPGAPARQTVPKEKLRYAERSFEEWKHVLATDLDPETRKKAVEALAAFGTNGYGQEAVSAIVEALEPGDSQTVAQAASSALGRIGPPAVPALVGLLKHERPLVRGSAAKALSWFFTPAKAKSALPAVPALVEATRDKDASVRSDACQALGTIAGGAQTPEALKLVVPALSRALKDDVVKVRVSAAEALRRIGPKAAPAVPALIEAIRASRPEPSRTGRANLRLNLRDDNMPMAAIQALGAIGPGAKAAIPVLTEIANRRDYPYLRGGGRIGSVGGPIGRVLQKIRGDVPSPLEDQRP